MSGKTFRMFIKKSEMYEKGIFKEIDTTSRLIKPIIIDWVSKLIGKKYICIEQIQLHRYFIASKWSYNISQNRETTIAIYQPIALDGSTVPQTHGYCVRDMQKNRYWWQY
jgi:hypothetical protein